MSLLLSFVVLALVAAVFVLWGLQFPPRAGDISEDDLRANRGLFVEKLDQLREQLDGGEISQDQYDAIELEYQRQFLADNPDPGSRSASGGGKWLVVACAVAVPIAAAVLYINLGATAELALRSNLEERSELFMAGKSDSAEMKAATEKVLASLEGLADKNPEDPTYQVLLARLYSDGGEFDLAIPRYLKASVLLPDDGFLLAEYAQILFFSSGNKMTDKIKGLAQTALSLTPMNQTALSLAGIASFQDEQFQQAIDYWTSALSILPPDAASRAALESGITAARERIGELPRPQVADVGRSLTIQVALDGAVTVPADTTVFVYARTWQGSPMPLAIRKLQVADLPVEVTLTEAMAMTPAMSLATVDQVEVIARISLSGAPTPTAGDYESKAGPIDVKNQTAPISLGGFSQITE